MGLRSRSSGGYAAASSRASSPVRCLRDSERSWKPSGGWRSEGRHGSGRPAYSSQTRGEPYVDSGPKGGMRYKEKVPSVGTRSPRSSAGGGEHLWRPVSTSVPQNRLEALAADSVSYTRQEKGRMRACIMTQRETGRDTCACVDCEADRRAEELQAEGRRCTAGGGGGGGGSSSRSCSARRQRQQQRQHRRPTSASAASSSAAASSPARSTRSALSSRASSPPPRHAAYAHGAHAAAAASSAAHATHSRSSHVAAVVDPHPQDGYGERSWDDGRLYEGMWTEGQMEGQGRMRYADGAVYDGAWRDGARCGQGELLDCDGTVTIGVWEAGSLAQTLYTIDSATGVVRRGGTGGGAGATTTIRVFSKILHAREEATRREAEEREEDEEKRRESQQQQQQQRTVTSMSMEATQAQMTPPRRTTPPSSAETTPQIADLLPVPSPGSAGVSAVNRLSVGRGGAVVESDLRAMWEVSPSTSPARVHERARQRQRAAASPPAAAPHAASQQHQHPSVVGASPDETYLEEFGSEVSVSPTAAFRMRLPRADGDGEGDGDHHHHHRRAGSRSPPRLPHPYVHEEEGDGEAADTLSPKAISPSPRGASPPRRGAAGGAGGGGSSFVGSSATSVVTFADLPSTGVRGGGAAGYLHQQQLRGDDDEVGLSSSPQWNGSGRPPQAQQQQQQQGHAFRSYTSVTAAEYYSRSVHEGAAAGDAEVDRPPRRLLACPMCSVLCLKHWQQRCPQCGVRALAKGVLVDKDNNPIIVAAQ